MLYRMRDMRDVGYWLMVIHISDQLHIVIMVSVGGSMQPVRTQSIRMFYC